MTQWASIHGRDVRRSINGDGLLMVEDQVHYPEGGSNMKVSIKNDLSFEGAEQAIAEVDDGTIYIEHILMIPTTGGEEAIEAVFDNITTTSSGNLYATAQETVIEDTDLPIGEVLHLAQTGSAVVSEADIEDARGLSWAVQSGDNLVWDGAGAEEATGVGKLVILYTGPGSLEIE